MIDRETRDRLRAEYVEIRDAHHPDQRGFCILCCERCPCGCAVGAGDVLELLDEIEGLDAKDLAARLERERKR